MKSLHTFLDIPTPCHQNWDAMSEAEQGRYCQVCAKTVIDFSLMSNEDILQYLNKSSAQVCGRFANTQLKPQATLSHKLKVFLYALCTVFLLQVGEGVRAQSNGENLIENSITRFAITGKVRDGKGNSLSKSKLELFRKGEKIKKVFTDSNGIYQIANLKKGNYIILAEDERGYYVHYFAFNILDSNILHDIEINETIVEAKVDFRIGMIDVSKIEDPDEYFGKLDNESYVNGLIYKNNRDFERNKPGTTLYGLLIPYDQFTIFKYNKKEEDRDRTLLLNKKELHCLPASNLQDMIKIMDTDRFFTNW